MSGMQEWLATNSQTISFSLVLFFGSLHSLNRIAKLFLERDHLSKRWDPRSLQSGESKDGCGGSLAVLHHNAEASRCAGDLGMFTA
jgi:hypothetical protein